MQDPLRPLRIAGVLAATLALAGTARAGERPALRLPFAGEVRAGETIELSWTGIDADVHELEILLSIDGGRGPRVRVSPELDPRAGAWRWRVPNLPTGEARLSLRIGRGRHELEAGASEIFRIVGTPDQEPERDVVHEGSWWRGPAPLETRTPGLSAACEWSNGAGHRKHARRPRQPNAASDQPVARARGTIVAASEPAAESTPIPRTPRFTPPRE